MGRVSRKMKAEAVSLGLCQEWAQEWGNPSKEQLVRKYIEGIDFCIKHDFPSCDYMKRNFNGIMQAMGVFVDDPVSLSNRKVVVANGTTHGELSYSGYAVGSVYARHSTVLTVTLTGNAICKIEVYDSATVKVVNQSSRKSFVYQYGGSVLTDSPDVIIKNRELER